MDKVTINRHASGIIRLGALCGDQPEQRGHLDHIEPPRDTIAPSNQEEQ